MIFLKKIISDHSFRQIIIMSISNIYGKAVALIANIVIANIFGQDIYGTFIYLFAFLSILSIISIYGVDRGLLNYTPKLNVAKKNDEAKSLALFSVIFTFLIGLSISMILYLFSYEISSYILNDIQYASDLKYFSFFVLLFTMYKVILAIFQSYGDIKTFAMGLNFLEPTFFLLSIIVINLYLNESSSTIPITGKYIGLIISILILVVFLLNRNYLKTINLQYKSIYKEFLKFSFPLLLVSALGVLMSRIDIIMVGQFLTSADVGIYNAAAQYAILGSFVLTSVNQVLMPKMAKLYENKEIEALKKNYGQVTFGLLIVSFLIFVFVFFSRDYLLSFYGNEFNVGSTVLILLLIGQLVNSICGPCGFMIVTMISPKLDLFINLSLIIINIFLNIILIPMFGINGAAFGTMLSFTIANLLKVFILYKKFNIVPLKFK